MSDKQQIINRALSLRAEIAQTFVDADHWNRSNPNELPINPDPDGALLKISEQLDAMLKKPTRTPHDRRHPNPEQVAQRRIDRAD